MALPGIWQVSEAEAPATRRQVIRRASISFLLELVLSLAEYLVGVQPCILVTFLLQVCWWNYKEATLCVKHMYSSIFPETLSFPKALS